MVNRVRFKNCNVKYGTLSVYWLFLAVQAKNVSSNDLVYVEWKRTFDGLEATASSLRLPKMHLCRMGVARSFQLYPQPNK